VPLAMRRALSSVSYRNITSTNGLPVPADPATSPTDAGAAT
jgi:hypothetical protein